MSIFDEIPFDYNMMAWSDPGEQPGEHQEIFENALILTQESCTINLLRY